MYNVFIDTCSFRNAGLNFNPEENSTTKALIKYSKKDINLFLVDITKNEILKHLAEKEKKEKNNIDKCIKESCWLTKYINNEIIEEHVSEKTKMFEKFLVDANVEILDIKDVSAEKVFDDYFNYRLPFENKKEKAKEFPDAFVIHKIKNIANANLTKQYIVITSDDGFSGALAGIKNLDIYSQIQELLTMLSNVGSDMVEKINKFIAKENYKLILEDVLKKVNIIYDEDEYLEFDIDHLKNNSAYQFNIIDFNKETSEYIIGLEFCLDVMGNFIKRDFDNSIFDEDANIYVYDVCDNIYGIAVPNIYVEVRIKVDNDELIYDGIEFCDDLRIDRAYSYQYLEKSMSSNRLENLIAVYD